MEGQGSGPQIDKKDSSEKDQFNAIGNKIDMKKAMKDYIK
jgi:elongation factor 3